MGRSWTEDEFGWEEVRTEFARIRRRIRSRWLATALLGLVLASLVVARQARREKTYQATVMLRVSEGQFDPNSAPPTSAQLQDYLWEVALSASRLYQVMDKYDLYSGVRKLDPLLALDEMRAVLDIDVLRNDFRVERDPDAPPRSARIGLHYSHPDPETALVVARALAHVIAEEENKARQQTTETALESMRTSSSSLDVELRRARAEESQLLYEMNADDSTVATTGFVRLRSIQGRIESLENEKSLTNKAVSKLGLRNHVEGKELGLRFEIIDPGRQPRIVISDTSRLAILGILSFLVLLPIAGVGIAAYDLRIYDADDLKRLGLEPFGHVPAFQGYRQGTLNDRLRKRRGSSC